MIDFVRKLLKKRRARRMKKLIDMPDDRLGKSVRSYFVHADKVLRFVRNKDDDSFEGLNIILFFSTLVLAIISFFACLFACIFELLPVPVLIISLIIPLVLFPVSFVLFSKGPENGTWEWYNGLARYRGRIGAVIRNLYRNDSSRFHKPEYQYYANPNNILDDWNEIPFITIPHSLSNPKYWSDGDYGRIMKLVTAYALIYEESDGHPRQKALDSFIYDEEVLNTVKDVVQHVEDRAHRVDSDDEDHEVKAVNSLKESIIGVRIDPANPDMARILNLMNSIQDKHEELDIVLRKDDGS